MFIKPPYLHLIVTAFRAAASGQSSLSSRSLRAPVSLRSLSTWFSKSTWRPVTPRLPRWLHHAPSSPPAFLSEYRKSLSPLLSPHDRSFETQSPKGSFGNVRRICHCLAQDPSRGASIRAERKPKSRLWPPTPAGSGPHPPPTPSPPPPRASPMFSGSTRLLPPRAVPGSHVAPSPPPELPSSHLLREAHFIAPVVTAAVTAQTCGLFSCPHHSV